MFSESGKSEKRHYYPIKEQHIPTSVLGFVDNFMLFFWPAKKKINFFLFSGL